MMSAPVQLLDSLPTELIIQILAALDVKSLLRCRQVCKLLESMIREAAALQYTIECTIAGMEDGPPSDLAIAERRAKLRSHQDAWGNCQFSASQSIPMLQGGVWELCGGVLAQSGNPTSLTFMQLPSKIRGIQGKEWTIEDVGFVIRDFTMDPAQNLLVMVETPREWRSDDAFYIHLRALDTSVSYPASPQPSVLEHSPDGDNYSYVIQISAQYLGVLFVSGDENKRELVIWNWKTGARIMRLCGTDLSSFVFLDDTHIVVAVCSPPEEAIPILPPPRLIVIDFIKTPDVMVDLRDADFVCAFHYPRMSPMATPLAMSVRSDPAPSWLPHSKSKVPFYTARNERLLVITLWATDAMVVRSLLLFVPTSVLLSHVNSLEHGETKRHFAWEAWGPQGTRMMSAPQGHSNVWVCYVWGMKYVSSKRARRRKTIQIFDFNQVSCKRLAEEENLAAGEEFVGERTVIHAGMLFENDVVTSLPYRLWTLSPPAGGEKKFEAVLVGEDSLIMVASVSAVCCDIFWVATELTFACRSIRA
ncbi:hypothetical protein B0H21DRAFT_535054, partial [Amylocystis lapponica]